MVIDLLRLSIFLFSIYGYMAFIHRKFGVAEECLPAIVISAIGCATFLAGILNILNISLYVIFILGCVFALKEIRGIRQILVASGLKKGIYFAMSIFTVYLLFYLKDIKYYQHDNFSHWGLIIKNIIADSSFPNFDDEMIEFQSYPVGTASLIWYICKIIGYTEGKTLFAQSFTKLTYSYSLFLLAKNVSNKYSKVAANLLVFATNIIIVTYGGYVANGLFDLFVDSLLAIIALSACSIMYYYRNTVYKAILCTGPLLIFVVCVKNSGIMWVIAAFIEAIILWHRELKTNKTIWILAGILGLPVVFRILWDAHVDMVFANGDVSSHAMTLDNYANVFKSKSLENIESISQAFFLKIVSPDNRIIYIAIGLLCFGIIMFFINRREIKHFGTLLLYMALIYVIYQFGNLAMYLFSMPLWEALELAEYERYVMTLELFLFGLFISFIIVVLGQDISGHPAGSLVILCGIACALLAFESGDVTTLIRKPYYNTELRESSRDHMDEIIDTYNLQPGKKILLYIGDSQDNDRWYRFWMSRYMLYTADVTVLNEYNVDELKHMNDYDYTILLERDTALENWLYLANLPIDMGECYVRDNYSFIKFSDYINDLGDDYILFMSVKDDASVSFDKEMEEAMNGLGLVCDLHEQVRSSYVAVVDSGKVIYENLDDEIIEYSRRYDGMDIRIISAGYLAGNTSQIMIDGIDYSDNRRGINVVIFDKKSRSVKDTITFDTYLMNGVIRISPTDTVDVQYTSRDSDTIDAGAEILGNSKIPLPYHGEKIYQYSLSQGNEGVSFVEKELGSGLMIDSDGRLTITSEATVQDITISAEDAQGHIYEKPVSIVENYGMRNNLEDFFISPQDEVETPYASIARYSDRIIQGIRVVLVLGTLIMLIICCAVLKMSKEKTNREKEI